MDKIFQLRLQFAIRPLLFALCFLFLDSRSKHSTQQAYSNDILIEIRGPVDSSWTYATKTIINKAKKFMHCNTSPRILLTNSYFAVPTPKGSQNVLGGYDYRSKTITVGLRSVVEKAIVLIQSNNVHFDVGEKLFQFIIAKEFCHYVQDVKGFLPAPEDYVGLYVTDLDAYDLAPHNREAYVVASILAPPMLTPNVSSNNMIEYLRRDSTLRGTGFPKTN